MLEKPHSLTLGKKYTDHICRDRLKTTLTGICLNFLNLRICFLKFDDFFDVKIRVNQPFPAGHIALMLYNLNNYDQIKERKPQYVKIIQKANIILTNHCSGRCEIPLVALWPRCTICLT